MPNGKLELERYGGLTKNHRSKLKEKRCDVEINRLAVDDCMKGKNCSSLQIFAILASTEFASEKYVTFTVSKILFDNKMPTIFALKQSLHLGEFKYANIDPYPAALFLFPCLFLKLATFMVGLKSGTVVIPSVFYQQETEESFFTRKSVNCFH